MIYRLQEDCCHYNFSGSSQQMLFQRYGDPCSKGWGNAWLLRWEIKKNFSWFPVNAICINKDFKPLLLNAFQQLEKRALHTEIKTFDEAFCIRFINGSMSVLSTHSWGAAIDLNAEENALGGEGNWSEGFIQVMQENGIHCGQNWNGRKDPMHFSMVNG